MGPTDHATITSEGQVTIPERIRGRLGLEAGDTLQFEITDDGELTVRRKRDAMERLSDVRTQLAPLEVDVDQLRHQAETDWSTFDEADTN